MYVCVLSACPSVTKPASDPDSDAATIPEGGRSALDQAGDNCHAEHLPEHGVV
ncbi:MAG: hypothetical protein JWN95_3015 [Frankiales bacterium]|nr:hypothetical protein [Frankiales bacterium]